jgi:hypothetical protein
MSSDSTSSINSFSIFHLSRSRNDMNPKYLLVIYMLPYSSSMANKKKPVSPVLPSVTEDSQDSLQGLVRPVRTSIHPFHQPFPFIRTALSSRETRYRPKPYSPILSSSTSFHFHPNSYENMSLPASLNADSRVAPPTTGGGPTVNTEKTLQPFLDPSRGGHAADGEDYTGQPSETYVDD